jgi:hypothetical protein
MRPLGGVLQFMPGTMPNKRGPEYPNVKVEILDANFVSVAPSTLTPGGPSDTYLFIKCRLLNTSKQSTTIRHWGLTIRVPQGGISLNSPDVTTDVPFDIYPAQFIRLPDFLMANEREPLRDIRNEKLALSRGMGEEGWVAGTFPARMREDFTNGLICLAVKDEFDQSFDANFMVVFARYAKIWNR